MALQLMSANRPWLLAALAEAADDDDDGDEYVAGDQHEIAEEWAEDSDGPISDGEVEEVVRRWPQAGRWSPSRAAGALRRPSWRRPPTRRPGHGLGCLGRLDWLVGSCLGRCDDGCAHVVVAHTCGLCASHVSFARVCHVQRVRL